MSGMLYPVGPEDPQVYWLRRAAIGVGALLVILVVIALIRPGGSATVAVPSSSPTPLMLGTPTPTPTPIPSTAATPGAAGAAPGSTPAVASAAAVTPQPTPTPAACQPADLRLALGGGAGAAVGVATTFTVQITNGSAVPCSVGWAPATAELRIFSGTDRIWSTDDCAAWFTPVAPQVVEPGKALSANVVWQGKRSYPGCKLGSTALQPGTYVATAEIDGAGPAQKVLGLR